MTNPLTYCPDPKNPDIFLLICKARVSVKEMPEHPVVMEVTEQLDETRECDHRVTGFPYGPVTKPSAWRGYFTIGTCRFRIMSMFAHPNFFGLVCDTEEGTHDPAEIKVFVDGVNAAVAAELGVESLG
ncbi:MAG: hypothetical protein OXC14_00985 [Rhodospirillaceae bacterium]|nr:hypothetical protein [Rhodospirillaceae bacterium]